jgi:Mg-chelatase subunit ChlD
MILTRNCSRYDLRMLRARDGSELGLLVVFVVHGSSSMMVGGRREVRRRVTAFMAFKKDLK